MTQQPSTLTQLSVSVLETLKQEFLKYQGTPFCFVETSHRSRNYERLNNLTVNIIKQYFNAEDYEVLLLATGSAMPALFFNNVQAGTRVVFYSSGSFSNACYQEMKKYHPMAQKVQNLKQLRTVMEMATENSRQIVHYNKIEDGREVTIQFSQQSRKNLIVVKNINYCFPWTETKVPTEDILYFDSEAGFSLPGFTVMLLNKKFIQQLKAKEKCPDMFDFLLMLKMKSVVNTPFTLCTLVLYHNVKYAYENRERLYEEVLGAKRVQEKNFMRLGCRDSGQSEEDSKEGKEAFNFIVRSYNERQERLMGQLSESAWINKDKKEIILFVQSQNSGPSPLWNKIMAEDEPL